MTAALPGHVLAFLRRASLLAGMLAIIAGILGMHIMSGSQSMPVSAASPAMTMAHDVRASAACTTVAGPAVQGTPVAVSLPGLSCAGTPGCATMSAMDAACVPFPGTALLAAPLPGDTLMPAANAANPSTESAPYAYLPGGPSPCDLCISRT
ncbi:hypothetical protein [Arthrobacter sp. UYCu723]